jgi:hypothetical protein
VRFVITARPDVDFERNATDDQLIAVLELAFVCDRSVVDERAIVAAQVANADGMCAFIHDQFTVMPADELAVDLQTAIIGPPDDEFGFVRSKSSFSRMTSQPW